MHMRRNLCLCLLIALLAVGLLAGCGQTQEQPPQDQQQSQEAPPAPANKDIILATTTSTQDSGLLDVLIPIFEEKTGYVVKTIAVGTGKALVMGEQGEADVLLVHAPSSEKKLVDEGIVTNYQLIMHNDFIIVGPPEDPAGIRGKSDVKEVFQNIAEKEALFVSRGDDSGTHKKELSVWQACNIEPEGAWYQEAGAGMGDTLGIAAEKKCYTLTDRATYLALKENLGLDVLSEGDPLLLNIYHVMQVNEEKFDKVNGEGAKAFVDFWVTDETQNLIGEFGKDKYGEPLFFPDAGRNPAELGL